MVSVIIPMFNERAYIGACLEAVRAQTYPADRIEVVVADGRSTDGCREFVETEAQFDSRIRLVDNPSGRTPDALNTAIRASVGEIVVRIDGHSEPTTTYVERCVAVLSRPGVDCAGGQMIKVGQGSTAQAVVIAQSSRFGVGDSAFHYLTTPGPVESVFLGSWPRQVFRRVGLFDPELSRNQDDEFSYRIREAGGTIWFDPSISIRYHVRPSLRSLFRQHRQYGAWKIRVFQKHPRAARWRHLVPGGLVLTIGAIPLVGLIVPAAVVVPLGGGLIYVFALIGVSTHLGLRHGVEASHIASAFAAMHFGYGLGLLIGLVRFFPRWFVNRRGNAVERLVVTPDPEATGAAE